MGVHDLKPYPEVKRLLGIPQDEPIFILRAQDVLYPAAISAYSALYMAAIIGQGQNEFADSDWNFIEHLEACQYNGRRWQRKNSERVKIPD